MWRRVGHRIGPRGWALLMNIVPRGRMPRPGPPRRIVISPIHCCPVNAGVDRRNPLENGMLQQQLGVLDFNGVLPCEPFPTRQVAHVRRIDGLSQLMGLLPPRQVRHCVNRYRSNHRVRTFSCRDQFLCMAFAQLTGRQSLRDIEACPRAMGPIRAKKNMDFAVRLSRKVDKTLGLRCDQTITLCGTKRLCCLSSCRCPCGRGLLFEQLLHGDLGGS